MQGFYLLAREIEPTVTTNLRGSEQVEGHVLDELRRSCRHKNFQLLFFGPISKNRRRIHQELSHPQSLRESPKRGLGFVDRRGALVDNGRRFAGSLVETPNVVVVLVESRKYDLFRIWSISLSANAYTEAHRMMSEPLISEVPAMFPA
jgi:hypothetical protein